ncbi:MAG TPA: hypothetical protein VFB78_14010 [Acidimicrobiales bacterium]|nr:hypothetical protein [Acidimicrobiales bacterium]
MTLATDPRGTIEFSDNALPVVEAGEYTVTASQTVAEAKSGSTFASYPDSQRIRVDAPRFVLGSGDLYSMYPPPNHQDRFDQTLPHVVLGRPTIPWERKVDPTDPTVPWLALLVFDDRPVATTRSLNEVLQPESGVCGPKVTPESWEKDATCVAIDVDAVLFAAIAPKRADLPLLAHVRIVDTEHKEIAGVVDGCFSVVVANRFPAPNGTTTVHLVSLEGMVDALPGGPGIGTATTVRLVSLASWTFVSIAVGRGFARIVGDMGANASLLALPTEMQPSGDAPPAPMVRAAFGRGYTMLAHSLRSGDTTASWYRGPLAAVPTKREFLTPYHSAAQATVYDSETGLFDESYAAAWQIGRLLALADGRFPTDLLAWRAAGHELVDLVNERLNLFAKYRHVLDLPSDPSALAGPDLPHLAALGAVADALVALAGGQMAVSDPAADRPKVPRPQRRRGAKARP